MHEYGMNTVFFISTPLKYMNFSAQRSAAASRASFVVEVNKEVSFVVKWPFLVNYFIIKCRRTRSDF